MKLPSLKRSFDIAVASTALVATVPVVLATGIIMSIANKSGPLLVQKRVGLNGKLFPIYKIKTMRDIFNTAGEQLPEDLRTTGIGKFIRKIKFDELPQLVNILKGDMSLTGPRPLLPKNDIAHDPLRISVLPGLTGLAQLKCGTSLARRHSLKYDQFYIQASQQKSDWGKLHDALSIMLQTIPSVIKNRHAPHFKTPGSL